MSRRSVLAVAASCALTSAAVAQSGDEENTVTRDSFELLPGTDRETTVYVTEADADGPTVVVVGGIHGNEIAGYVAANEIAQWTIDAGTLVTIPEANTVAIERGTRVDDDGVDLNRQFPEGEDPETELARAIWDVVVEADPEVVLDLHESIGIYAGDPVDGVGQAIFHSGNDAAANAEQAAEYVNDAYVDDSAYHFETGTFSGPNNEPSGLLVHKAARDLGADSFLVETLSTDHDLETRVRWQGAIVERLIADGSFPEGEPENDVDEPEPDLESEPEPDPEPEPEPDESETGSDEPADEDESSDDSEPEREPPNAEIRLASEGLDETALEAEQTVELDATDSCAPDGEIVCYEWSVTNGGGFEETGETLEVTIAADGEYTVVLRVVDDAGATDTAEITLSTA